MTPAMETGGALAAVVYSRSAGFQSDQLLFDLARQLAGQGYRLAGAVQSNTQRPGRRRCDMMLEDLASGRRRRISEDRGVHASGCQLDSAVLEEMVGLAAVAVRRGADLLIVNKFGKRRPRGGAFAS